MVVISLLVKTLSRLRDDSAARSSSSEKAHDESLLAIATINSKEIGYDQAAYCNKASYYTECIVRYHIQQLFSYYHFHFRI